MPVGLLIRPQPGHNPRSHQKAHRSAYHGKEHGGGKNLVGHLEGLLHLARADKLCHQHRTRHCNAAAEINNDVLHRRHQINGRQFRRADLTQPVSVRQIVHGLEETVDDHRYGQGQNRMYHAALQNQLPVYLLSACFHTSPVRGTEILPKHIPAAYDNTFCAAVPMRLAHSYFSTKIQQNPLNSYAKRAKAL